MHLLCASTLHIKNNYKFLLDDILLKKANIIGVANKVPCSIMLSPTMELTPMVSLVCIPVNSHCHICYTASSDLLVLYRYVCRYAFRPLCMGSHVSHLTQPTERWVSSPAVWTSGESRKPLVMPAPLGWPLNPCQPWQMQMLKLNILILLSQVGFLAGGETKQKKVGMWRERCGVHGGFFFFFCT